MDRAIPYWFCLSIIANGGVLMPLIIIVNWSISPFSSTICVVAGLAFFIQLNDLYILIDEFRWFIISIAIDMLRYAKSLQSCPTLCNPIDGSPPGSAIPGILQARILEWVAISFNAWKRKVKVKSLSRVRLLATTWTAAHQAPLSMDFPGKSTGVGCHCLLW